MTEVNPFYSVKCTPAALNHMMAVREAYKALSDALEAMNASANIDGETVNIGPREFALAKTNLEQSAMWAIKSISHYNEEKSN